MSLATLDFRNWLLLSVLYFSLLIGLSWPHCSLAASPGQEALDQGSVYYREGRYAEAFSKFKESTKKDPALLKAWENLGRTSVKLKQFSEARQVFDTLIKLSGAKVDFLNSLANDFRHHDEFNTAIYYWDKSLALNPAQPKVSLAVGDAYAQLGDCTKAIREYQKLIEVEGFANVSIRRTTGCLVSLKRPDEARDLLIRHLTAFPDLGADLAIIYSREGQQFFLEGDFAQAQKLFAMASKLAPNEPGHLVDLGWAFRRAGYESRAIDSWIAAFQLDPKNQPVFKPLGDVNLELGNLRQADFWYQGGIKNSSVKPEVLRNLGWAYWKNDRLEDSRRIWLQYADLSPQNPEPLSLLARHSIHAGDYAQAAAYAKQSLVLNPDQPNTALTRVQALLRTDNFDLAREETKHYLAQFPGHLGLNQFFGDTLMQYHDFEQGEEQWRKVLNLGGNSERAHVFWIRSLYEQGKYESALRHARDRLSKYGPNKALYGLLINDALRRGDDKESIDYREKSLRHFPDDERMWVALSEAYRKQGDNETARRTLIAARQRIPLSTQIKIALAELELADKNFEQALREFRILQEQIPNNRRVFAGLLSTLIGLRELDEAIKHLDRNRKFFLTREQEELFRAAILADAGDFKAANKLYESVRQTPKNSIDVAILLYHGIGKHQRAANISQAQFDEQLKALSDAGFTSITVEQLRRIIDGELPAPPRPFLVTFDDARIDAFSLADPVLKRYGMNATMFVPTGLLADGHPFFGDWNIIRQYYATGRWDLQSHGHKAHNPITVDSEGRQGPFLTNYEWHTASRRFETPGEFVSRLDADYRRSINSIDENIPTIKVSGFALPFSEAGQEDAGNVRNALNINEHLLGKHFRFAFIQDQAAYNRIDLDADSENLLVLQRFSVPEDWTGSMLVSHLRTKSHVAKAAKGLAAIKYRQGRFSEAREAFTEISEDPYTQYYLASMDYQQSQFPEARARLASLEAEEVEPALRAKIDEFNHKLKWHINPSVEIRYLYQEDSNNDGHDEAAARADYPVHDRAHIWLEPGMSNLRGNVGESRTASEISSGARFTFPILLSVDAAVRYRNFDQGDNTFNYWLASQYEGDRTALSLRWSQRDIDSLRAKLAEIDSSQIDFTLSQRFLENWFFGANASYIDYSDDIQRTDFRFDVRYRLRQLSSVSIGPDLVYRDANGTSPNYYAPDELTAGRFNVYFNDRLNEVFSLDAKASSGWAHDRPNGNRFSSDVLFQLNADITDSTKGLVGMTYSRVPDYDNLVINASLHYLF
ncbi:MAG: tetratricopeptide repeat protein [Deltaproteobacteria bacterium]|nr:tetratricopeptide repeat protein [Deltaproteobacteria bacterium]